MIGAGGIGRELIRRLEPHDVKVLAVTRSGRDGTIPVERIGEIWGRPTISSSAHLPPRTPST